MAGVTRGEQVLNRIASRAGISEDGKQWLLASLDPFHDKAIHCNGYPDTQSAASVVQLVKQSLTISCPTSITTGTWDCSIAAMPWYGDIPMAKLNNDNGVFNSIYYDLGGGSYPAINAQPPGSQNWGGLVYQAGQTGSIMDFSNVSGNMELNTQYWGGAARIIASGFEVTNSTAPIYAQGMVTTWRSPSPPYTNGTIFQFRQKGSTTWSQQSANTYVEMTKPPKTTQEAMLLNGSRQWAAKEGAYVVCAQHGMDNPAQYSNFNSPLFKDVSAGTYIGEEPYLTQGDNTSGVINYKWVDKFWTNFDPCGAFFTGLSLQTTLTITWHIFVERFPSFEDVDLIVLATPSPKYDPQALELYSAVMSEIPTGVMVKENGLGDWFREAVKIAEDVVTPALSMIPHPAAQGIAKGLSFVTPVAKALAGKKKQEQGDQNTNEMSGAGLSRSSKVGRSANSGKAVKNTAGRKKR